MTGHGTYVVSEDTDLATLVPPRFLPAGHGNGTQGAGTSVRIEHPTCLRENEMWTAICAPGPAPFDGAHHNAPGLRKTPEFAYTIER